MAGTFPCACVGVGVGVCVFEPRSLGINTAAFSDVTTYNLVNSIQTLHFRQP